MHLEMILSMLKMTIGYQMLATLIDMEGRKDKWLMWVLQESKHKHDLSFKWSEGHPAHIELQTIIRYVAILWPPPTPQTNLAIWLD